MTLPNPGSWQAILEKEAPQLFEDVSAVRDHVLADRLPFLGNSLELG